MAEIERLRAEQERMLTATLARLVQPYRSGFLDLRPARDALLGAVASAPDGTMPGREIVGLPAFESYSRAVQTALAGFAGEMSVITREGVQQAALAGRDDAVAMLLSTVHPDDRKMAMAILEIPGDDALMRLIGL